MDKLKKLIATPRGRVIAGGWLAVLLAVIVFLFVNMSAGPGVSAIKPIHLRPTHRTTTTAPRNPALPQIASKIPPALAAQLIDHAVAVVEIYNPGLPHDPVIVDQEARNEAQAGAKLAGAGYAAVDVTNEAEMQLVNGLVNVSSDPYVFILDRAGDVLFQRAGFLDQQTIAQAAANALVGAQAADPVPIGPSDGISGPYDGYWKAKVDQLVCSGRKTLKGLTPSTGTSASTALLLKRQILVLDRVLAGMRSVRAIGPDTGTYAQMIATYAQGRADRAVALAALSRKPSVLAAFSAAMRQSTTHDFAGDSLAFKIGIACFTDLAKK